MPTIEFTIHLPETLAKEALELGILSDEHIEKLIREDIQAQLANMANDPQIQHEIRQIDAEFGPMEGDGLDRM